MKRKTPSQNSRENSIRQAADTLEELLWLLDSKRSTALKKLPQLLREHADQPLELNSSAGRYISPNPNKHFLIGILPRLFQDSGLFPSNEDIADFASSVLKVNISRFEKRSKYELIGLIVCQTNELDEFQLSNLVQALEKITGSDDKLLEIAKARKTKGLNWNEAIRQLGQLRDD